MDEPATTQEKMIPLSAVTPLLTALRVQMVSGGPDHGRTPTDPLIVSVFDRAAVAAGEKTISEELGL